MTNTSCGVFLGLFVHPSTKNRGVHPQNVLQNIIFKIFVLLKKKNVFEFIKTDEKR